MKLFERLDSSTALVFANKDTVSYSQLRREVDRFKNTATTQAAAIPLEVRIEPRFFVELIGYFELGRPVALMNPLWAERERQERLALLRFRPQDRTRWILFTSGSGGRPRAVQLSWENVDSNTRGILERLEFHRTETQHLFLPLWHSFGLLGQLIPGLRQGLKNHLYGNLSDCMPTLMSPQAGGMWSGMPFHWETILKLIGNQHCPAVTHVIAAGAPFPEHLRRRLHMQFSKAVIYSNYGLTECSPRVLSFSSKHKSFFSPLTGLPQPELQVKVEDGELLVQGPQVMLGYLGEQAETDRALQDGWLHTGDQAEMTPEGLVRVLSRKDDLVLVGGERISLQEVESMLKSLPYVTDAVVVLKTHPLMGALPVALIVAKPEDLVEEARLVSDLRPLLSANKIPKEFHFPKEIPRLENGKIDTAKIQTLLGS